MAARFFNPDRLEQEELPTHVKEKRRQTELAAKNLSGHNFKTLSASPDTRTSLEVPDMMATLQP